MRQIYISMIVVFFSLNVISLAAQSINQDRYKLAETFENNGDYKGAAKIYEELYKSNPGQDSYFKGISRTYTLLNQYSALLPIIESHLKQTENVNAVNLSLYAETLWKTGKTDEANKAWNQAINDFPKETATYSTVSNSQIKLQLFDKAVSTLETARTTFKKSELYADELSQLYIVIGDFKKASEEIIVYYLLSRNLAQAQGRISAMLNSKLTVDYLDELLKSRSKEDNLLFMNLYAWYLRVTDKLENSLELYIKIDKLVNGKGLEIYNFANTCSKDNQFDIALKAYGYVIDLGKASPYIINSLYGFSRVLESRSEQLKSTNPKDYEEIINRYRSIIALYPNNNISYDAMYRIAEIYFERLHQTNKSIDQLNELSSKGKNIPVTYKGINYLADIYFALDKIDSAKANYNLVVNSKFQNATAIQVDKDYAQYKLALLEYFSGNIDSAMIMFKAIADNSNSNTANDALEKMFMLETNKSMNKAIKIYALAEMKDAQNKTVEAIKFYEECLTLSAGENLGELCLIKMSGLYSKESKFNEMRSVLNKLIQEYPESIYMDLAYYNIAKSYYSEKNFNEALKYYTEMLLKFPKSIYIEDIREKIRIIRANSNG